MDKLDRTIINRLQGGLPLCDRPYREAAQGLGTTEDELLDRLHAMLNDGRLSRFGPLYNVERMGGSFTLCAMAVPGDRFDEVAGQVNALPQVAHNYERDHRLNMWFVLATERPEETVEVMAEIERRTKLEVLEFPKLDEYYVGLHLDV